MRTAGTARTTWPGSRGAAKHGAPSQGARGTRPHYAYLFGFVLVIAIGVALSVLLAAAMALIGIPETLLYYHIAESLVIVVFGYTAVKMLAKSIVAYGKRRPAIDEVPLAKIISLIGYAVILILVLSSMGISVTGILVSTGFLGIVVGLAAQGTLGNLFAGISMMASKPFTVGERVTFSTWQYGLMPPSYVHGSMTPGYSGIVRYIGLMYTKLVLDDGRTLVVPNGVMNQAAVINYAASDAIGVDFRVELPIGSDFGKFMAEVQSAVRRRRGLRPATTGGVSVVVTDIGISNYGVDIKTVSTIKNEKFVRGAISEIALSAVRKFVVPDA